LRRHRPLARFRVEGAARTYAAAHENAGTPVVILHRDEDPELGDPSSWTEVYRTCVGS
jgi:hypothetical protein